MDSVQSFDSLPAALLELAKQFSKSQEIHWFTPVRLPVDAVIAICRAPFIAGLETVFQTLKL